MINFIAMSGVLNMLGGRWKDVAGQDFPIDGRMLMRCIASGLSAAGLSLDLGLSWWECLAIWFAVTAGSALWYPWGWSFAEQHGVDDPSKYPKWVRKIGHWVFPINPAEPADRTQARKRGMLMKGIRGMFDILTFALLSLLNPWAMAWWLGTLLMGVIYYLASRAAPGTKYDVMAGEFVYGLWRGYLIRGAIAGA